MMADPPSDASRENAMLVSVIMPIFNAARWVVTAIDNLEAQTYPHIELVVVNDASQDDSVAVVRQRLAKGFKGDWRIVELTRNVGPSAARNIGVKAAKGDWIQFLDSDDFLAADKLQRQMAVCANAPAAVSAVYSSWQRCYYDNGKISLAGPYHVTDMDGKAPIMCLVGDDRYLHNAGLVRRSVFEAIGGFDETLRFWECEEINVRIARAGRLVCVPSNGPSYLWRMHRGRDYLGGNQARYRMAPAGLSWISLLIDAAGHRPLAELNLPAAHQREVLDSITSWARR
ncbi:MAG TPA: glycosyltransferase family A protein, partial [Rhizomicrobium sp.]|nr:glycosyltransferase family A protein [Rhizomicrobium sp.]